MSRIKNPLTGVPKHDLLADVEDYGQKHQLTGVVDLSKKGALVAQNPDSPDEIEELSTEGIRILTEEKTSRLEHPKTLYFHMVLNSISAAIQGWDQTGSSGANISFPQVFGIADTWV